MQARAREENGVDGEVLAAAEAVLRLNDRGDCTVPAQGLYPHQWNWDSALIALGWATFDQDRAWRELETLVAAQDAQGFIPHIAFTRDATGYVPGPEWWGDLHGADGRRTSGISQPPVAATCARLIYERFGGDESAKALLAPLQSWHDWLLGARDPDGRGEPVVIHPWETGRDNAVEWDAALERSPVTETVFERADTGFVDAEHRPTKAHYNHYLGLVEWCRERGWNHELLARECPFRVLDSGFSALLAQACEDLEWLALKVGDFEIAEQAEHQSRQLSTALNARVADDGSLWSVDLALADNPDILRVSCSLALAVTTPRVDERVVARARELVTDGELACDVGVLSTGRGDEAFAGRNYWRGPSWANVTWLTALGFERRGDTETAALLRDRLARFASVSGMREYADANTGEGLGAREFAWTAALTLWEFGPTAAG